MKLCPPPAVPLEPGVPDSWQWVEREIGLALPQDYKDLVHTYGTGSFSDFLWLLSPFTANKNLHLVTYGKSLLDGLLFDDKAPSPMYPCAVTDNGDEIFWKTVGRASDWTMVLFEPRGDGFREVPCSLLELLHRWLSGKLHQDLLPPPGEFGAIFEPLRDLRSITVHFAFAKGTFEERLDTLMRSCGRTKRRTMHVQHDYSQCTFSSESPNSILTYSDNGQHGASLTVDFEDRDEPHWRAFIQDFSKSAQWIIRLIQPGSH